MHGLRVFLVPHFALCLRTNDMRQRTKFKQDHHYFVFNFPNVKKSNMKCVNEKCLCTGMSDPMMHQMFVNAPIRD